MPDSHVTLVAGPDTPSAYRCLFCGEPIASADPQLLPLTIVAGGKWRRFFAHRRCLRERADARFHSKLDSVPVPRPEDVVPLAHGRSSDRDVEPPAG